MWSRTSRMFMASRYSSTKVPVSQVQCGAALKASRVFHRPLPQTTHGRPGVGCANTAQRPSTAPSPPTDKGSETQEPTAHPRVLEEAVSLLGTRCFIADTQCRSRYLPSFYFR